MSIESSRCGSLATLFARRVRLRTPLQMALIRVEHVERVTAKAGAVLVEPGQAPIYYWVVLRGRNARRAPRSPTASCDTGWDSETAKASVRVRC